MSVTDVGTVLQIGDGIALIHGSMTLWLVS